MFKDAIFSQMEAVLSHRLQSNCCVLGFSLISVFAVIQMKTTGSSAPLGSFTVGQKSLCVVANVLFNSRRNVKSIY